MAIFVITGAMITERAREMWADRKYSDAYRFLGEAVPGMTRDQQTALLKPPHAQVPHVQRQIGMALDRYLIWRSSGTRLNK